MMKKFTILVALLFMMMFSCNIVFAGTQDFILVNKTGFDIKSVYVSPSNSDDWQEDVLGRDYLSDGDSVEITFSGSRTTYWDIRVEDSSGDYLYWKHFNLKEISKITLKNNGNATYE